MKILLLTKKFPYPTKDGESVAVHSLTTQLSELGAELHLLSMNTTKHFVDIQQVKDKVRQYASIRTVSVDNRIKVWPALKNLWNGRSFHIERFDIEKYSQELAGMLQNSSYDAVLLESVYLTPYVDVIRAHSSAAVVMRAHNVEFEIWQRIVANTSNPVKKGYLRLQADRLKDYEYSQLTKLDGLITFTKRDLQKYQAAGYGGPSLVSPIGIPTALYDSQDHGGVAESVAFIGSLDWQPNIEGLMWFLQNVWPLVLEARPAAQCHIAGRNPTAAVRRIDMPGVTVHGEVADAAQFVRSYPISIVPLLSGSGMRVKILEAMALGRCIVTTSVGAEGIRTDTMKVADQASDFARAVISMLVDTNTQEKLGAASAALCQRLYDSQSNSKDVLDFIKKVTEK